MRTPSRSSSPSSVPSAAAQPSGAYRVYRGGVQPSGPSATTKGSGPTTIPTSFSAIATDSPCFGMIHPAPRSMATSVSGAHSAKRTDQGGVRTLRPKSAPFERTWVSRSVNASTIRR